MSDEVELHTLPDWDKPKEGLYYIYTNRWWKVDEQGNPLFYSKYNAPQCNPSEGTMRALNKKNTREIKQIPMVFVPVNPKDL